MSNSSPPHGLQPTRLLCPLDFPGKSTGVGCHFLLQRIFLTQESNPDLPHCRQTLYQLSHQGSLYRLVITFLPRSKHLLISWLQLPSAVILEPKKIKSVTVSIVSPSICYGVMGLDAGFATICLYYSSFIYTHIVF